LLLAISLSMAGKRWSCAMGHSDEKETIIVTTYNHWFNGLGDTSQHEISTTKFYQQVSSF
jgi:hypothetical protein